MDNKEIESKDLNKIIVQHNDLISGKFNWNANEIKIVMTAISKIKDENNLEIEFSKKEITNLLGVSYTNTKDLELLADGLIIKIFERKDKENNKKSKKSNNWAKLTWFQELRYKDGKFYVHFNTKMVDYLLNLKSNFTKYNIMYILPMKSHYSMRIYQLLKQYQNIGKRTFELEHLKEILKVPESYEYGMFKKRVLLTAQKELEEHTDIRFSFLEVKQSRKIIKLVFDIKKYDLINQSEIINDFKKYYGKSLIDNYNIQYDNIIDIQTFDQYLEIKFENNDLLKLPDEKTLISLLVIT